MTVSGRQLWTTAGLALAALLVQRLIGAVPRDPLTAAWVVMSAEIAITITLGFVAGSFRKTLLLVPLFVFLSFASSVVWSWVASPQLTRTSSIVSADVGMSLLIGTLFSFVLAQPGVLLAELVERRSSRG